MGDFWVSAGRHLVEVNEDGWLAVTPDLLRAYYTRPEMRPVPDSCPAELALFEALMADPFMAVTDEQLAALADEDAAENYRVVLEYRTILQEAGTIEGAYLRILRDPDVQVPPLFIEQMVHLILHNVLSGCDDPLRLRAGELFFREQRVSTDDGRIMLADEEIFAMLASQGTVNLGQLITDLAAQPREVVLDVLNEGNKQMYWQRSDRFDTVIDFRFTEPALDAFARVVEAWIAHFLKIKVRVHPKSSIEDDRWCWHIGIDAEATRILNALYDDEELSQDDLAQLIALFQMDIEDQGAVMEEIRGRPVYLALAMTRNRRVRMKPQNLLFNLPLTRDV